MGVWERGGVYFAAAVGRTFGGIMAGPSEPAVRLIERLVVEQSGVPDSPRYPAVRTELVPFERREVHTLYFDNRKSWKRAQCSAYILTCI